MRKGTKRALSILLSLLLAMSVFGVTVFAEDEATKTVTYIDAGGEEQTVEAIVAVPGAHYSASDEENWYVIEGEYSGSGRLFFEDAVTNLILADDADWTITSSEEISIGNVRSGGGTLNVYVQENNTAKLRLTGGMISYSGAMNIYGGSIFSYKIGGSPSNGDLTASDCTLTGSLYGKNITLRDCTVTGNTGNCTGVFTLDGGSYTAVCASTTVPVRAASIAISKATVEGSGGQFGLHATNGSVTISNSAVNVTASNMGISGSSVSISGGNVTAIATGNFGIYSASGPIEITGGTVHAEGSIFGLHSNQGVALTGGSVTAAGNAAGVKAGSALLLGADDPDCSYTLGSVYSGATVTVKEGQTLTDGENNYTGTLSAEQVEALAGKTLTAFDPFAADKAAFEAAKESYKAQLDALLQEGDSDAVVAVVTAAKAIVDATAYDESKSLPENIANLTSNYVNIAMTVVYERILRPFIAYRDQLINDANALLQEGDSDAVVLLIADAVAALNDAQYDQEKSLDENKAALDAIVAELADAVAAQRAADEAAAALEEAKAELAAEIEDARAYYESIKDAYAEIADDLDTRLQRAEAVLESSDATLEDVDAMTQLVRAALEAAQEAVAAAQAETPDEPGTPDADGACPLCGKTHSAKWVRVLHYILYIILSALKVIK